MRIRATVAAVSGALALSAFAVPAAQADDSGSAYGADVAQIRAAHVKSAFGARADAPYDMDVTFSNFKIAKSVKVGTTQQVLVDAIDGELAIARSMADAPEIDGLVQVQDGAAMGLKPGTFAQVRIMGADEHDLYALAGPDPD